MRKSVYIDVPLSLQNSYTTAEALGLSSMLCAEKASVLFYVFPSAVVCILKPWPNTGLFQQLVLNNGLSRPICKLQQNLSIP